MAIDNALGLDDLIEGDAVLVVAAVRPMRDEAPDAAGAEVEGAGRAALALPGRFFCFGVFRVGIRLGDLFEQRAQHILHALPRR
jgi:hypothetical protein